MQALHIALQEGFSHDEVLVRLDNASVYHGHDIATRQQIGLAASFDSQAEMGTHALEVSVPTRGLFYSHILDVSGEMWVGISVASNRVQAHVSATPFGYV
jgi:hypothetical protein